LLALPLITAEPPIIDIRQEAENEDEPQQQQKPELRSFLYVAVDDVCSSKSELPVEIKCNVCVLLLKIVQAANSCKCSLFKHFQKKLVSHSSCYSTKPRKYRRSD
jgi:hypothetical protein